MRSNFAGDFHCDETITVTETAVDRFRATGCGKEAVYQCIGKSNGTHVCSLQMVSDSEGDSGPIATRGTDSTEGTSNLSSNASGAKRARSKKGSAVIKVELKLDETTLFKLTAFAEKKPNDVALKLMYRDTPQRADRPQPFTFTPKPEEAPAPANCDLAWLINGQRIVGPEVESSRKENIVTVRARISQEFLRELGVASKMSLGACEHRWSLSSEQLAEIRRFVELYDEEAAWQQTPRAGGTGGLVAPNGGWSSWTPIGQKQVPAATAGPALDPPALFKQLKRSVYQIESLLTDGTSLGSAVAVTTMEVLTNCHVLEGARKIILKQEQREWVARLSRSDPKSDRCILAVSDPALFPIQGVRTWESLEIGEPLYALGSPAGLELSLSSGILSGRREEGNLKLVQTTAAISPGSSGGGLFDARGNLVGITTLVLAGRERLNQALNFAIPAEGFWMD